MSDFKIRKLQALKDLSKETDEEVMEKFKSPKKISKAFEKENKLLQSGDRSLYPEFRDEAGKLFHTPVIDKRTKILEAAKADSLSAESELLGRGYQKRGKTTFKHLTTGKILKSLGILGTGLSLMAAPSADAAVMDAIVPGGVESMGVSDEQKMLDQQYKQRIQQRQQYLNRLH